jgi:hypothetical protein
VRSIELNVARAHTLLCRNVLESPDWSFSLAQAFPAGADVLIAGSMVYYLYGHYRKAQFSGTRHILRTYLTLALSTNAVTGILSIAAAALYGRNQARGFLCTLRVPPADDAQQRPVRPLATAWRPSIKLPSSSPSSHEATSIRRASLAPPAAVAAPPAQSSTPCPCSEGPCGHPSRRSSGRSDRRCTRRRPSRRRSCSRTPTRRSRQRKGVRGLRCGWQVYEHISYFTKWRLAR